MTIKTKPDPVDDREEILEELRQVERLSTVSRLASHLAHELGTPLNVVSGRAMMIASGEVSGQELIDNAKIIVEQANRMTAIIRQMLSHARRKRGNTSSADVTATFHLAFSLLERRAARRNVTLKIDEGIESLRVRIDQLKLLEVLTNLLTNAVQSMENGGTVVVGARREVRGGDTTPPPAVTSQHGRVTSSLPPRTVSRAGTYVCFWVRDEGCGINKELLPNIFKPFYTTKEGSERTGLGLSIAHGIVRDHGGWIDVESEVGTGSTFKVCLPEGGA